MTRVWAWLATLMLMQASLGAQVVVDVAAVLSWETPAEVTTLADVGRLYTFRAYLDDATSLPLTPTCTGSAPPFTCQARGVLTAVPLGAHTLRMSTSATGREGPWSAPLAFTLAPPPPGPPVNLRLSISATDNQGQRVPLTITVQQP